MSHIICLLLLKYKEHFEELIKRGHIYIACPPLYRITVKGKYIFFKNDLEFNSYKTEYISNRYQSMNKSLSILDITNKQDEYLKKFNLLKNQYNLTEDIVSMLLSTDIHETAEYLDEQGLDVSETTEGYYAQGLMGDEWIDLEINNSMESNIKNNLQSIYGVTTLDILDKKEKEAFECDIYDGINLLDSEFKFSRYRFKGLN